MKLGELLSLSKIEAFFPLSGETEIRSIISDSRKCGEDSLFVCISGSVFDGHNYARSAYDRGCRAFVAEKNLILPDDAAVVYTPNTRIALAKLSSTFFGNPSSKLKIIGITGTKGKTSTAEFIHAILSKNGRSSAYIGSNGVEYGNIHKSTPNTTPESYLLHQYMRDMVNDGVKYLVMEVSSQAILQNRIHGINFDTCVYTNLSPDHISEHEHPSFDHYKNCKHSLFAEYGANFAFYNADDEYADFMLDGFRGKKSGFSIHTPSELHALPDSIKLVRNADSFGTSFVCTIRKTNYEFVLNMPDEFSIYNALGAIAVCHHYGIRYSDIADTIKDIKICGRFQSLSLGGGVTAVIDYAHNCVSLASALLALRKYRPTRIICLFGSVGGRTQIRRKEMGRVASELSDLCILTSDNPDNEPPEQIIDDIKSGFGENACPCVSITDRRQAIEYAVKIAEPGDVILLAGKGHERYQLVGGRQEYFNEYEILTELSENRDDLLTGYLL